MQKTKILFAMLIALLTALYAGAQVSLKIKLSSPEHGDTVFIYDIKDPNLYIVNNVSFKMIPVQGGTFTMGCTDEQDSDCAQNENPSHDVTLYDYYIGQTEVTQALWVAVTGSNPSFFQNAGGFDSVDIKIYPVEMVSWEDIVGTSSSAEAYTINGITYYENGFCHKLTHATGNDKKFRLPTEAEWEYAARGGSKAESQTKYSGSNIIDEVAWYSDNASSGTQPVAVKQANALGIYDMSGNVYEWCSDFMGDYSSESQTNPIGANSGVNRIARSGCWIYSANLSRVSHRQSVPPDSPAFFCGFRLALSD